MRRLFPALPLILVLPLAACFDMEMTADFTEADRVSMTSVMTMTPDMAAMAAQSGEDLCDGGTLENRDDGVVVCTTTMAGSIDEILADPEMGEGLAIEKRDSGEIYVAFMTSTLTDQLAPPEDTDATQVQAMMAEAFTGHVISMTVRGVEIVETNGTLSEDGTSASFVIPLEKLFDPAFELPESFETVLIPGT